LCACPLYRCVPRLRRPPRPTLFPYTTLFRSSRVRRDRRETSVPLILLGALAVMSAVPLPLDGPLTLLATAVIAVFVVAAYYRKRSEEHTSELQSRENLVCRLLLEKKKEEDRE